MFGRQQEQQRQNQGYHEVPQQDVTQQQIPQQQIQQEQMQRQQQQSRMQQQPHSFHDQQQQVPPQSPAPPPYLMYSPLWRNSPYPNGNVDVGAMDDPSRDSYYGAEGAESEGSASFDDADVAAGSRRKKNKKNKKMNKMIWQKNNDEKAAYYPKHSPYPIYFNSSPVSGQTESAPLSGQTDLFFSTQKYHSLIGDEPSVSAPLTDSSSISSVSERAAELAGATTLPLADSSDNRKDNRHAAHTLSLHTGKEDVTIHKEPIVVVGMDITHLSRQTQFIVCAVGVFGFSLLYGYLQELISVTICNRKLGLFLATVQFAGYAVFSYFLRTYVNQKKLKLQQKMSQPPTIHKPVPWQYYAGVSLLRAIDLAMTNLAMQYINYPAKTLMKSSRIVFTMIFGVLIGNKKYRFMDYVIVACMVLGLCVFMHADANSSAVFHPMGVIMLTISLICDGAVSNYSEHIMSHYNIGQDEFIFNLYSISLIAITAAAAYNGDLGLGLSWMLKPGTYDEVMENTATTTWSATGKIVVMVLFSSMGFIGSSFSAAITKHFGALVMSITSTARKATTVFLSFFLFDNECTLEHIAGVIVFIAALTTKSLRRTSKKDKHRHHHRHQHHRSTPKKRHQNDSRKYSKSKFASFFQVPNFGVRSFFGRNKDISNFKKDTPNIISQKSRSSSASPIKHLKMDVELGDTASSTNDNKSSSGLRSRSNTNSPLITSAHPDLTNRSRTPGNQSHARDGSNHQPFQHVVTAGTHIV